MQRNMEKHKNEHFFAAVCTLILLFVDIGFVLRADDNPITSKIDPFPQTFPRTYSLANDTAGLFPADMPTNEWLTFEAAGFSKPVTGIIYRDASVVQGVPMGGLGTGYITLNADGTLDCYSSIFSVFLEKYHYTMENLKKLNVTDRGPCHRYEVPSLRLPFLGIAVDGEVRVLSLQKVEGTQGVDNIDYWGHYPVADLKYEMKSPVKVSMRAWTPFLPGDSAASNTPGSVYEVRLQNTSEKQKRVTLGFSFCGPRHEELADNVFGKPQPDSPAPTYRRQTVESEFTGVMVDTTWEGFAYSYALGIIGSDKVRIGGQLTGKAWNDLANRLPDTAPSDSGASVATDFVLKPKENRTVYYVMTWHAPSWNANQGSMRTVYERYDNMYASRFQNALGVAQYLAKNHISLRKRILAWQEVLYTEGKLPGWLQDSLINCVAVLPQLSFWMKSPDPDHWIGEKGLFCVNESLLACPQMSCLGCDWIGEWGINLLFPELGLNKLSAFKHYQKPNGQTPSALGAGTETSMPWYDQQITQDGSTYVQMLDRYWQATGDDSVLEEYYLSVKAQMHFMMTVDKDGDWLPDAKGGSSFYHEGWLTVQGAQIHMAGYWLATLRIAERMALKMDDQVFAEECRSWFANAKRSIEKKLWNPEVGSYLLYNQPEKDDRSDTILCDQLLGDFVARLHGFDDGVFPKERVKTVLETIWNLNIASTQWGVRTSIRPDGSFNNDDPGFSGLYHQVVIVTYSSIPPLGLMIYTGNEKRGLEVMERSWRRVACNVQMPWDCLWAITADTGMTAGGIEYYMGPMLWTVPVAVMGDDIKSFCARDGLMGRIVQAAKEQK